MGNLALNFGQAFSGLRTKSDALYSSALLIPPAYQGSLGDAATISATAASLRRQGVARIDLLCGTEWHQLDEKLDHFIRQENLFGKPSALPKWLVKNPSPIYAEVDFIGAQLTRESMNSVFRARLSLLQAAAEQGRRARLLSCGSIDESAPELVQLLQRLPEQVTLSARDSLAQAQLETLLERPVQLAADLAFLLEPRRDHPLTAKACDWIQVQRSRGLHILGLNVSRPTVNWRQWVLALRQFMAQLMTKNLALVIMPLDFQDGQVDAQVLQEIMGHLGELAGERVYLLPCISPGIVRAVSEEVDVMISNNYHSTVLALAGGTPVFCLDDCLDIRGLLQTFGLPTEDVLCPAGALMGNPRAAQDRFLDLLARKGAMRLDILQQLPAIQARALSQFA